MLNLYDVCGGIFFYVWGQLTVKNGVNAPRGGPQNNFEIASPGRLQRTRGVFQNKIGQKAPPGCFQKGKSWALVLGDIF